MINEAIDMLQEETHDSLNHTKCKSHAMRAINSNMAESRHEERNKNVESSRALLITHHAANFQFPEKSQKGFLP